jgi:hypothetical protein
MAFLSIPPLSLLPFAPKLLKNSSPLASPVFPIVPNKGQAAMHRGANSAEKKLQKVLG